MTDDHFDDDFARQEKRYKRAITRDLPRTAWCWGKRFHVDIRSSFGTQHTEVLSGCENGSLQTDQSSNCPSSSPDTPPTTPLPPVISGIWRCKLSFDWPISVRVSSSGLTQEDAERNAFLIACVQLRTCNIFNESLSVPASVLERLFKDGSRGAGRGGGGDEVNTSLVAEQESEGR